MKHVWEQLSMFESQDLCRRFYKAMHGRELSAGKASEICAHFSHGRAYFESAAGATDTVRPLLLYYGVQALSRGLILFLDPKMRESGLTPSHGLQTDSWTSVLSRGIEHVSELRLRPSKGTFTELVRITHNVDIAVLSHGSQAFSGSASIPEEFRPTLREVLSRIPELWVLYEATFREHASCFLVHIHPTLQNPSLAEIVFPLKQNGVLDIEELAGRLRIPPDVHLYETDYFTRQEVVRVPALRVTWGSWHDMLHMVSSQDGDTYVIAPFSSGERLSQLTLYFAAAFTLGMLVRYHPTTWTQMLMRGNGDYVVPLIKATIRAVESRFPELVFWSLTGHQDSQ